MLIQSDKKWTEYPFLHLKVHVKPFSFEGESEREKEEIEKIERAEGK